MRRSKYGFNMSCSSATCLAPFRKEGMNDERQEGRKEGRKEGLEGRKSWKEARQDRIAIKGRH